MPMTEWTSSPRMTDAIANTKQLNAFRSAAAFISAVSRAPINSLASAAAVTAAARRQSMCTLNRYPAGQTVCYPVRCPYRGKTEWPVAVSNRIDKVMQTVPAAQRCRCHTDLVSAWQDRAEWRGDPGTRFR